MHMLDINTLNHFEDSIQYPSDISMPPQSCVKQNNANPYSAFIPTSHGVIVSVCVAQCLIFPQQGVDFRGHQSIFISHHELKKKRGMAIINRNNGFCHSIGLERKVESKPTNVTPVGLII
ncbi:hypothetical protein CEXT_750301 [Caerostris extrusa]|uniref:Uncharacterized protein n=1 Tax=Caerostris extrusa TaxID=172846 RepID=A0AAV4YFP9_CAEEX|nr:hypothetical protein CEXT_750301 [Caerostris extrusa]